jgi:hypothetical protein
MSTGNGRKSAAVRDEKVLAVGLRFERGRLVVALSDEREVSVPIAWYPTLRRAPAARRNRWRLIGGGLGIHWPDLDLDLSVAGLTQGLPEAIPHPPKFGPTAGVRVAGRRSA